MYTDGLRDLYSAETQLTKALPKIAEAVESPKLQAAVKDHLEVTKNQKQRLETIFEDLGEKPSGHVCKAMQGLIEEGSELIDKVEAGPVRDAALIGAAQKVEHYEIAGYGTMCAFAKLLGLDEHAELLNQTLEEESETDEKLTSLAEGGVNEKAASKESRAGATAGAQTR